jgi:hypothetical protein
MRPVPLSLCAGTRPPRAHLTRVRGLTFTCAAASAAVSHSEVGVVTNVNPSFAVRQGRFGAPRYRGP